MGIIENENKDTEDFLSIQWMEELDRRAEYMDKHPNEGKSWDDVKQNLQKDDCPLD